MQVECGHALVTGASSGIGAAVVDRLLAAGWRVTGVSRGMVIRPEPQFDAIAADLATPEGCAAVLSKAQGITAFVHCAGHMTTGGLGALDAQAGEAMWRLHVSAAETIANDLLPQFTNGARILLIGSRTASGSASKSQYAAAKAAMVAMARSWAIELAAKGVTVNVVAPAATETAMLFDPARTGVAPQVPPIGRYIQPAEVAATVQFLLSRDADAITGQVITICGGASL